ncbi:MAG TPA: hypothetical protein VNL17_09130 [Verrucomicrobiae bacterium]|nr:hypothetical protein [Verrucomicrobiae bacterium]
MNDDQLNKLFAAARGVKPDTSRAEYGFETRLMAHLRTEREQAVPWYAFAWKLVPAFAAIVVALGVWTYAGSNITDLQSAIAGDHEENALATYVTGGSQ